MMPNTLPPLASNDLLGRSLVSGVWYASISHPRYEHVARSRYCARLCRVLKDVNRNLVTRVAKDLVLALEKQIGSASVIAGLESAEASPVVAVHEHFDLNPLAARDWTVGAITNEG